MLENRKDICFLGAPVEDGQSKPGVGLTPSIMRDLRLIRDIEKSRRIVHDCGDIDVFRDENDKNIFNAKFPRSFLNTTMSLSRRVRDIVGSDCVALTIGGDHSLSTGTILGHSQAKEDICVVWVDAHADINTPITSVSGNIHGMPVAFLLQEMQKEMPVIEDFADITPVLPACHLAYIGLRDVDPFEKFAMDKYGIKSFYIDDIDNMGIEQVVDLAIASINPNNERSIHLSFDIDALDPEYAPSTGTPVRGGLTLKESVYICSRLHSTGKLNAIDIAEINTELSTYSGAVKTLNSARAIIFASLGIYGTMNDNHNDNRSFFD